MEKVWEDWFQHQRTWELLQKYTPQRRVALRELLALCEYSSDPKVAVQAEKYKALCATIDMLTGTQKGASEDGE